MKKILPLIASVVLMTAGCARLLDLEPSSAVSPSAVGTKDIAALRSGMYFKVQESPTKYSYIMFDLFGGELTNKSSTNPLDLISTLASSNNGIIEGQWEGYYKALMQVNNVYSIAQGLPEGAERNKMLGECCYFRAYLHLALVTRFGDVPLMRENTDAKVARTPAEEVWKFIEEELDVAMKLLGAPEEGFYYLSADAATALRARVALYRGDRALAAELAESLIADARYNLSNYEDIFRGKPNDEIIFAFSCLTSDQSGIAIGAMFYSYNHPNSGSYEYVPSAEVMSMYDESDNRKDVSVMVLDNLPSINKYPSGQAGTDPVIISRLGEMYLISAEAKGLEDGGVDRLNELRTFRGLSRIYPASETELVNAVIEERRRELLGEGHRWYDLVRHGKAVEVLGIQKHQVLLPVPASERRVNENLTQNEGY